MKHIVLIGDSIFDNASYVDAGDSVIEQLTERIANDCKATLIAVDGDITQDVYTQLDDIPIDSTHVFLSIGGNDALRIITVLNEKVATIGEAMEVFSEIIEDFQLKYYKLIATVKAQHKKLVICTIHDCVPNFEKRALTALAFFNEIILKQAFALNLPVIDLRLLCNEEKDYSPISPIEPSKYGAEKIVKMINTVMINHDFKAKNSIIYS